MPELIINLLGKITIKYKNDLLENKLSNKGIALICYLIINADKPISRDKVACNLWADSDDESSKYNLRYNLWSIKRIILPDKNGEDFLISDKNFCHINKNYDFFSDIMLLKKYENKKDMSLEELLALKNLFNGDFMEGLYLKKCPDFNDMVLLERIIYQNKHIEILNKILEKYIAAKQYNMCIDLLNEMLSIDPYNEDFANLLIEIYYKNGNRIKAISFYKTFESNLRKNLNISPSNTLKLLYNSLLDNENTIENSNISKTGKYEKQPLSINTFCLKDIPFFWIADTIGKIVDTVNKQYFLSFDANYISDLASIQNKILLVGKNSVKVPETIPSVRIINAFCEFLKSTCEYYSLTLNLNEMDEMDPFSRDALHYLENNKINGLKIVNSKT